MNPITGLLTGLAILNSCVVAIWVRALRSATDIRLPSVEHLAIGFATNFFDTLGIGSYAQTTSWYKIRKIVNDRIIPGTMTVGHNLPTTVQTFIYTTLVQVDVTTLFSMIGASAAGAWLGAGVVAKWPKRKIQLGMGSLLLIAATLIFFSGGGPFFQVTGSNVLPLGGDAIGVSGIKLVIAVLVNFVLGALMTLGIGIYAPCMITVYLLGMTPKAAFPIMMGSCGFLIPVAAIPFIKENAYSVRAALGLTFAGIPGVLTAAYLVGSADINKVKWLVVLVVLYTSISMLRSAFNDLPSGTTSAGTIEVEA